MMRGRWVRGGGPVFVGAVAAVLTLAGCSRGGGASDDPSSDPSPTASANPAISAGAAPTPSPAPSGFLPVDSLGASEIPWDEVGPGWFLVEWVEHDRVWAEDEFIPTSPADASVSLLSPDGTWYTAESLSSTGHDETVGWLGDTLVVFGITEPSPSLATGSTALVNLRTGASRRILSAAVEPGGFEFAADGTLVGTVGFWEYTDVVWYDPQMAQHTVCRESTDRSVAPDRVRFVCFHTAGAGVGEDQTEILVGALGSGAPAEVIDTFRLEPGWYVLRGWLDADTFLVSRQDPVYGQAAATYYTYNIVTRKVADFALPYSASPSAATDSVYFDWATQTYADSRDDGLHLFAADGAPILVVPCSGGAGWAWPPYSGTRVMVTCSVYEGTPGHTTLTLVDLESGTATEVADVPIESGRWSSVRAVYPYTGNLD